MKKIRILHVAAFYGNLGDELNHSSFKQWVDNLTPGTLLEWTSLDLREVWRTDRNLLARIQARREQVDLIVFGGGNFWETWDETSQSGTSLNVTFEQLKNIGLPVFFNALGVETARGVSKQASETFVTDFERYCDDPQFFVSVRNDGSNLNLEALGVSGNGFLELPDHAFFHPGIVKPVDRGPTPTIAVNGAVDMDEIRYGPLGGRANFLSSFSQIFAERYSEIEFNLVFLAQVPSDLQFGLEMASNLPEAMTRKNFSLIFPNSGLPEKASMANIFNQASMIIAQRFHSTIMGLTSHNDTVCFSNHPKVENMLDIVEARQSIKSPISEPGSFSSFGRSLTPERIIYSSHTQFAQQEKFNLAKLASQRDIVGALLQIWLEDNFR